MAAQYGRPLYFAAVVSFFLLFFLAYSQWWQIGRLAYFHRRCGLSANFSFVFLYLVHCSRLCWPSAAF